VKKGPRKFEVTTDHAVTGVLGTQFVVAATMGQTTVMVVSGAVDVTPVDQTRGVTLRSQQRFRVQASPEAQVSPRDRDPVGGRSADYRPAPPGGGGPAIEKISPQEMNSLTDAFARLEEVRQRPGWHR
jgi:hypothetical protein